MRCVASLYSLFVYFYECQIFTNAQLLLATAFAILSLSFAVSVTTDPCIVKPSCRSETSRVWSAAAWDGAAAATAACCCWCVGGCWCCCWIWCRGGWHAGHSILKQVAIVIRLHSRVNRFVVRRTQFWVSCATVPVAVPWATWLKTAGRHFHLPARTSWLLAKSVY